MGTTKHLQFLKNARWSSVRTNPNGLGPRTWPWTVYCWKSGSKGVLAASPSHVMDCNWLHSIGIAVWIYQSHVCAYVGWFLAYLRHISFWTARIRRFLTKIPNLFDLLNLWRNTDSSRNHKWYTLDSDRSPESWTWFLATTAGRCWHVFWHILTISLIFLGKQNLVF